MGRFTWIELACSAIAGLLGTAGLAYATFGPTYRSSTGATASLVQVNGPQALLVILVLLAMVLAVPAGAYLHGWRQHAAGLVVLWGGAVSLAITRVLTGFSIGGFIQPAAAFALISAVAGSSATRHRWRWLASGAALFWTASSLLYFVLLTTGDTPGRIGQSIVRGPLAVLAWVFDPRYLRPLLG